MNTLKLFFDCAYMYRGLIFELLLLIGFALLIIISAVKHLKSKLILRRALIYVLVSALFLFSVEVTATIRSSKIIQEEVSEKVVTDFCEAAKQDSDYEDIKKIVYDKFPSLGFEVKIYSDYSDEETAKSKFVELAKTYEKAETEVLDKTIDICFTGYQYDKTSILIPVEPSEWTGSLLIRSGNIVYSFTETEARKSQCDIPEKLSKLTKLIES